MNTYSIGYRTSAVDYMARRTAERNAQFALAYCSSGDRLLDCGCGPGSITLGLANHVAPGHVIGIDRDPSQIETARARAQEAGIDNARFEVADIGALPFEDGQFDLVFCHTVLCHMANPAEAIAEMRRVLRRGGCIALRDIIASRCIYWPESAKLLKGEALIQKVISHSGGDPDRGAQLGRFLCNAGFSGVFMTASYDLARTAVEKPGYYASEGELLKNSALADVCLTQGWASEQDLVEIAEEWRRFGNMSDTLFALPYGEAIGWKL